jgi:hypothetical protein
VNLPAPYPKDDASLGTPCQLGSTFLFFTSGRVSQYVPRSRNKNLRRFLAVFTLFEWSQYCLHKIFSLAEDILGDFAGVLQEKSSDD